MSFFKKLFNGTNNGPLVPTPDEMKKYCDAATQSDGLNALQAFHDKFGPNYADSICPTTGYTAPMRAAQHGILSHCNLLISNGANVNAKDKDGWSPLMVAVNHRRHDAALLLLNNNADINAKNNNGMTPLMTAAREADERVLNLLLERGADPQLVNSTNQNAAAVARSCSTGPTDLSHARIAGLLDQAIADRLGTTVKAMAAANQKVAAQVAEGFSQGIDKPLTVSRPLTFKS